MFRTRKKAHQSHSELRRLLNEQLESRQLMASDMMQWAPLPAHLVAMPSSTYTIRGGSLSSLFSGGETRVEGRTEVGTVDLNNLPTDGSYGFSVGFAGEDADFIDFGEAIIIGEYDMADVMPVPAELIRQSAGASLESGDTRVEDRIDNLPTDGSFGFSVGFAGEDADFVDFGEAIIIGEYDMADVMPVPPELIRQSAGASLESGDTRVEDRIDNLPTDVSFGFSVGFAGEDADFVDFGEAIIIGEYDMADVMPVPPELIRQSAGASLESGETRVEGRTDNLPTDGSFGFSVGFAGEDADFVDSGEAIIIGEYDMADVMPVPPELIRQSSGASQDSGETRVEDRIDNLPTDGSFGFSVGFAGEDADFVDSGEAIIIGEYDMADVMPVPPELIRQSAGASLESGDTRVEYRIDNLPTDGSFGFSVDFAGEDADFVDFGEAIIIGEYETTDVMPVPPELLAKPVPSFGLNGLDRTGSKTENSQGVVKTVRSELPKESIAKIEKLSASYSVPWNGLSTQRRRTSESSRNQLVDSALAELLGL